MHLDLTDHELITIINSVHERAMRLGDYASAVAQVDYRDFKGNPVPATEYAKFTAGSQMHHALCSKLRSVRDLDIANPAPQAR